MLKFFNPEEELPNKEEIKIRNQKLDKVKAQYDHNYRNFILACTHKKKFNRNIYIPRIIQLGLCYTIHLLISSSLLADNPTATVFNSQGKVYNDDTDFWKKCDLFLLRMIHEHQ